MTTHARSPRQQAASGLVAMIFLLLTVSAMPAAAQERPPLIYSITFEQLEYRAGDEADLLTWDGDLVVGTDEWKLRLQSEAEYDRSGSEFETLENQLLVQQPLWDFFDVKAGLRFDTPKGPNRVYGVLGLQGLAPQWFEVDADLFLSERGDASMRFDVEYELLFTNRLILTPSAEVSFAFSDDRDIGVGSGLGKLELGMRLSYDLLDRAVSPYIGVHFEQLFGPTKRFARADGEPADSLFFVGGVRLRF